MPSRLIHCSYHKNLTVYYRRVMDAVFNRCLPWSGGYRHYNSDREAFYQGFREQRVASVNNHSLDLGELGGFRLSRFLRDPRDLVVSAYFYHRRGAEEWVRMESPTEADWAFANAVVPRQLRERGGSLASLLESLPEEDGLLVELELRERHLESMLAWPDEHPAIRVWRYEDVLGRGPEMFSELLAFYRVGPLERILGTLFARRYSLRRLRRRDPHIRNPRSGQWRDHFTPRVREAFESAHPGLVEALGYAS